MGRKKAAILSVLAGTLASVGGAFAVPTTFPSGVTVHEEGVTEGYVLFRGQDRGVYLIDSDGTVVHTWAGSAGALGPIRPLPNGHVLYVSGGRMVEFDWDGASVWEFAQPPGVVFHHDWSRLANGNTLILGRRTVYEPSISDLDLVDDVALEVSPAGEIVWEWQTADHYDEFGFSQERKDHIYASGGDWAHINTVSAIPDDTSHGDPRFSPGNVILSLRNQNTIAIVDRGTSQVAWLLTDVTIGQHDPQMLPDDLSGGGNILVFDNGWTGSWTFAPNQYYSRVLEIDPVTGSFSYVYTGDSSGLPRETFLSSFMSGAQRLWTGNTLIVEAKWGRIFEVTPSGQLVWEYISPYANPGSPNTVYRAYKVPLDWAGPHFVPDLVLTGSGDPAPVETGGDLHYTLELENTGSDPAVNVTLTQTTPAGTTFQSIFQPTGWDCETPAVGATGTITCLSRSFGSGAEAVLTLVVAVNLCDPGATTITHTATVSSDGTDATPGDNSTTVETDVGPNTTLIQDLTAGLARGGLDVRLDWGGWGLGCAYRVRRSTLPSGGFTDISGLLPGLSFVDAGAGASPDNYYYLVEID